MNGEYLYEAMGDIGPVYVEEAEKVCFPKPLWRKLVPLAACLAVFVGMYAGFLTLLYGAPIPGNEILSPSMIDLPLSPAAQTAAEFFRTSPWFILGSLLLGLTAWGLPLVEIFRKNKQQSLTMTSWISCILSLLLQVCCVIQQVNSGDRAALSAAMEILLPAAVVLTVGTAVLNVTGFMIRWQRRK